MSLYLSDRGCQVYPALRSKIDEIMTVEYTLCILQTYTIIRHVSKKFTLFVCVITQSNVDRF